MQIDLKWNIGLTSELAEICARKLPQFHRGVKEIIYVWNPVLPTALEASGLLYPYLVSGYCSTIVQYVGMLYIIKLICEFWRSAK